VPLTVDNLQQSNSGTFTGTSGSATLGSGTQAGNTVILVVYSIGSGTLTTPTGFVLDHTASNNTTHKIAVFRRSNVPAGETSWTVAVSASQLTFWAVREYSGIDLNSPKLNALTVSAGTLIANTDRTISSIYAPGAAEDAIVIGVAGALISGATPPDLFVSPNDTTSGSGIAATEADSVSGTGGGNAATLSVFEEFSAPLIGQFYLGSVIYRSDIGTINYTDTGVAYRAKGSALYPTLTHLLGGQHGTTAGWTTGTAGSKYLETASAGFGVTTTNPRHDTYCFRANATSAACNATGAAVTIPAGVYVKRLSFRLNSTPAANLELGGITGLTFRWIQATGKIGCVVGGGTEQVSTATVAAGSWWSIDYRVDTSGTTWQCEWTLTPDSTLVAETEPTATGTGVATTSFTPRMGWTTATTGDVNFADLVGSSTTAAYPLGNYQVKALKIDGTQAVNVSGTSTNFQRFTANGTMATLAEATAAQLVDDLPATIGASADGIAQVTAASSDNLQIFFENLTLGSTMTCKGARCCIIGWAASSTSATIRFGWRIGAADKPNAFPVADYAITNSTTAPTWLCTGVEGSGGSAAKITQANLTSTAVKYLLMGFSTDATPDIGMHAAYIELAVKVAPPLTLQRGPDGNPTAVAYQDSDTSGYVGLQFTAPPDRGMDYSYEYPAGTTNGPTTLAAGASSSAIALDASVQTDVPRVNCTLADPAP
jgi:hypothetical protein